MSVSVVTIPVETELDMFASAPQCSLYGGPSYGNSPYVVMTPHDSYWMAEFSAQTLSLCSPVWFVGATIKFANGHVVTRAFVGGPINVAPGDEINVKYRFAVEFEGPSGAEGGLAQLLRKTLTPPARPL